MRKNFSQCVFLISTTDKQQMQMQEKEKKSCAKKKEKGNKGQRAEIKQPFNNRKKIGNDEK